MTGTTSTTMSTKVVELHLENLGLIRAVDLTLDKTWNVVGGNNEQGKSTILRGLAMLLGGKKYWPPEPIRKGADQALLVGKLDNGWTVELVIPRDGQHKLKVKTADGAEHRPPQTKLDELFGPVSFDPTRFARADAKEQAKMLAEYCGIDLEDFQRRRDDAFNERTVLGRQKKHLVELLAEAGDLEQYPTQEVDAAELRAERQKAAEWNDEQRARATKRFVAKNQLRGAEDRVEELRRSLEASEERYRQAVKQLEAIPEPEDEIPIAALDEKLEQVHEQNRLFEKGETLRARKDDLDETEVEIAAQTELIASIDRQLAERVAAAKLPIEGLELAPDGVRVDGLPFEQASTSKAIKVSSAIGMGNDPGIVLMYEGAFLDDDSKAIIRQMAEERDVQVVLEVVGKAADCTFIMADGEATTPAEPEPTAARKRGKK